MLTLTLLCSSNTNIALSTIIEAAAAVAAAAVAVLLLIRNTVKDMRRLAPVTWLISCYAQECICARHGTFTARQPVWWCDGLFCFDLIAFGLI
jgi:hypothetical protein